MAENETKPPVEVPVECPMCKHKFLHKIEAGAKKLEEAVGEALGNAKFGE